MNAGARGSAERGHDSGVDGLRLFSYGRVSDVRGREGPSFISPSEQMRRNRSYCEAYGHTIVDESIDLDRSGGDMSRPVFDAFLERIRCGDGDGIIVAKLDRFARSNLGALQAIEEIEKAGGVLISVQEQIDPRTASGRFMRNIFLATAQMERERIGEQWHTARTNAVERGIHISHHVPPGYVRGPRTNDPQTDRRLHPHPVHAETIRQAFRMACEGESDYEIANLLNQRELPIVSVKHGEKRTYWQTSRIPRLLANRAYIGEARSGNGIVNATAHEPLVDENEWKLAQRGRRDAHEPRRPNRTSNTPISILSGICRCAGCSFAMKPQEAGETGPAIYRCVTTSVHGRCGSPSTIAKARLEDYVIEQFLEQAQADLVASPLDTEEDGEWHRLVAVANAAERSYRAQLTNEELRGEIGDEDHDRLIATLHRTWQQKLAQAEQGQPAARPAIPAALPAGMSLRELVEQLRGDGHNEELRSLLASGIEAVFIRPARSRARNLPVSDRVRIVFRGAENLELPRRGRRFEPRSYTW